LIFSPATAGIGPKGLSLTHQEADPSARLWSYGEDANVSVRSE
jgi:hypothetical protein